MQCIKTIMWNIWNVCTMYNIAYVQYNVCTINRQRMHNERMYNVQYNVCTINRQRMHNERMYNY